MTCVGENPRQFKKPKTEIVTIKGRCGHPLKTKTFRNGTSVKCTIYEGTSVRWNIDKKPDILKHIEDFCKSCYLEQDKSQLADEKRGKG